MISFFGSLAQSSPVVIPAPPAPAGTKVIVLVGQSNAEGFNNSGSSLPAYLQAPLTGFYRSYNNSSFAVVSDAAATIVGPDVNLGYLYQQFHNENIYIIKVAAGGTTLASYWSAPSGTGYVNLKAYVTAQMAALTGMGLTPTIRGFVWYQGESDGAASISQASYQSLEQTFFSTFKTDFSVPNLKIYSCKIQQITPGAGYTNVRAAKVANSSIIPNYTVIDVDDLATSDGTHLTVPSQIELGRRLFTLLKFN